MAVNRYTNITPSEFNPLSMQEMAFVPAMRRQEHDAFVAANEEYGALLDQVKAHQIHSDEVAKIRGDIYNQIDTFADELNRNGVSPGLKNRAIGLNRTVRDELGPQGRLGQIAAEYAQIEALRKQNAETAQKMGQDVNYANSKFNKALAEYADSGKEGWFDGRDLKRFGFNDFAVKNVNRNDRLMEFLSKAGVSAKTIEEAGEYIVPDGHGFYKINSSARKQMSKENYEQLNGAFKEFTKEYFDPTSDLNKSERYKGTLLSPEQLTDMHGNYVGRVVEDENGNQRWVDGMFAKNETLDSRKSGTSAIHGYPEGHPNNPMTNQIPVSLPTNINSGLLDPQTKTIVKDAVEEVNPGIMQSIGNVFSAAFKNVFKERPAGWKGFETYWTDVVNDVDKAQHSTIQKNLKEALNKPEMQQALNLTGFSKDEILTKEGLSEFMTGLVSLQNNTLYTNERLTNIYRKGSKERTQRNDIYQVAVLSGASVPHDASGKPIPLNKINMASIDIAATYDNAAGQLGKNNVDKGVGTYKDLDGNVHEIFIPSNDELRAMNPVGTITKEIQGRAKTAFSMRSKEGSDNSTAVKGTNGRLRVRFEPYIKHKVGNNIVEIPVNNLKELTDEYGNPEITKETYIFYNVDEKGKPIEGTEHRIDSSQLHDYLNYQLQY